jgi:hypothetical protein
MGVSHICFVLEEDSGILNVPVSGKSEECRILGPKNREAQIMKIFVICTLQVTDLMVE